MRRFFRLPDCTVECCPKTETIRIAEFASLPSLAILAHVDSRGMRQVIQDLDEKKTLSLERKLARPASRLRATSL